MDEILDIFRMHIILENLVLWYIVKGELLESSFE